MMAASLQRCECGCGLLASDKHHIVTRGAGGIDDPGNIIHLCRSCHSEVHMIGVDTWAERYGLQARAERARELHRA